MKKIILKFFEMREKSAKRMDASCNKILLGELGDFLSASKKKSLLANLLSHYSTAFVIIIIISLNSTKMGVTTRSHTANKKNTVSDTGGTTNKQNTVSDSVSNTEKVSLKYSRYLFFID